MTDFTMRWNRQGLIPASRNSPERRVPDPIYTSLQDSWERQGKTVPGRPDKEWLALMARDHWPRG
ncbi:hypothetical protein ACFWY6_20690 [Streptomyces sp. NPDC059037]|uniref:hypothetical protein n=1 Tax=Streptomyces sp. NPDC059037 TaxID=3346710 RepID=UPI00367A4A35